MPLRTPSSRSSASSVSRSRYWSAGQWCLERIFGLPGLGLMLIEAVTQREYVAVQGVLLVVAAVRGIYELHRGHCVLVLGSADPVTPRMSRQWQCVKQAIPTSRPWRRRPARRPGAAGSRAPLSFARRKPLGAFGATVLILTVVVAVFSPWIARYPYAEPHFSDTLTGAQRHVLVRHRQSWGRTIFSRMVIGSQVTVLAGLGTVIVASVLAVRRGRHQRLLRGPCRHGHAACQSTSGWRCRRIFLSDHIPFGAWDRRARLPRAGARPGSQPRPQQNGDWIWYTFFRSSVVIFSLGIIFAGYSARIVRGAVLAMKENVYMEAARVRLAPLTSRILLHYVLPERHAAGHHSRQRQPRRGGSGRSYCELPRASGSSGLSRPGARCST